MQIISQTAEAKAMMWPRVQPLCMRDIHLQHAFSPRNANKVATFNLALKLQKPQTQEATGAAFHWIPKSCSRKRMFRRRVMAESGRGSVVSTLYPQVTVEQMGLLASPVKSHC